MAIEVTWGNVAKMLSMVAVCIGLLMSAGVTVVQWQMDTLNKRLDERLAIYQKQNEERAALIERINTRVLLLEQRR